jgi:hypothetical protein
MEIMWSYLLNTVNLFKSSPYYIYYPYLIIYTSNEMNFKTSMPVLTQTVIYLSTLKLKSANTLKISKK